MWQLVLSVRVDTTSGGGGGGCGVAVWGGGVTFVAAVLRQGV